LTLHLPEPRGSDGMDVGGSTLCHRTREAISHLAVDRVTNEENPSEVS